MSNNRELFHSMASRGGESIALKWFIALCGALTEEGEQPTNGTSTQHFEELSTGGTCRKRVIKHIKLIITHCGFLFIELNSMKEWNYHAALFVIHTHR